MRAEVSSLAVAVSGPRRLALAVAVGVAVALALGPWTGAHTRLLAAWDAAAGAYLGFAWALMRALDARGTRARAGMLDPSVHLAFLIVVAGACASVVAISWGLREARDLAGAARVWSLVLATLALAASWLLIHTVFAFHYARTYYRPRPAGGEHPGGLRFPGGADPDFLDFLYYACVIGMTSQVSDVAVTSRRMRTLTLVHGVLSFAFNVAILALGINLAAAVIE